MWFFARCLKTITLSCNSRLGNIGRNVLRLRGWKTWATISLALWSLGQSRVLLLDSNLVSYDANVFLAVSWLVCVLRRVLESGSSTLEPVNIVLSNTISFGDLLLIASRESLCFAESTGAAWSAHLVIHELLADFLVATERNIASCTWLGQVESTTEILLAPLCTKHLLLLLLLGKVKLVDATGTVLGGQSGHRVGSCIRIDYSSHMHLKVPDVRGLLVRLNIVARDKVE